MSALKEQAEIYQSIPIDQKAKHLNVLTEMFGITFVQNLLYYVAKNNRAIKPTNSRT